MKSRHIIIGSLLLLFVGCATTIGSLPYETSTKVELSKKNYRVVKMNAIGQSSGFWLFGMIPIVSPTYPVAMSNLYANAGVSEGGSALALANVSQERSSNYFVLFAIPKLTVRADVIEFVDDKIDNRTTQKGKY